MPIEIERKGVNHVLVTVSKPKTKKSDVYRIQEVDGALEIMTYSWPNNMSILPVCGNVVRIKNK